MKSGTKIQVDLLLHVTSEANPNDTSMIPQPCWEDHVSFQTLFDFLIIHF